MSDHRSEDERLKALLTEAHAADRAPGFERLLKKAPRRRSVLSLLLPAGAGLALVVAFVFTRHPGSQGLPRYDEVAALSRFEGPTDFLLKTPGDELLSSVPSFSAPDTMSGANL